MSRWLKKANDLLNAIQENIPKKGIKRGKNGNRKVKSQSRQEMRNEITKQEMDLEWSILELQTFLNVSDDVLENLNDNQIVNLLRHEIDIEYRKKFKELREKWLITPSDVTRSINAITEITLWKHHKIINMWGKDISVRFDPTGHLVSGPSCSMHLRLPYSGGKTKGVLFSGDQWNRKLWYPGTNPDFTEIYDSADALIMESTYGRWVHPDRSESLRKFDAKISDALRNGIDVIVITLALERPIFVLYEILKCLENNKINPESVDIAYNWASIGQLFAHFPKWEIRDMVKPFLKPLLAPALTKSQKQAHLKKLGIQWKRTRIILTSWGFFPPEWPSAHLMEHLYSQEDLLLVSPNFHGEPGSNGHNFFNNQPYKIDSDTYHPKPWHETFRAEWFSGHSDAQDLTRYGRKTIKNGGKIFLNHGSEKSREALAARLASDPVIISKKAHVVLPKANRHYKATR